MLCHLYRQSSHSTDSLICQRTVLSLKINHSTLRLQIHPAIWPSKRRTEKRTDEPRKERTNNRSYEVSGIFKRRKLQIMLLRGEDILVSRGWHSLKIVSLFFCGDWGWERAGGKVWKEGGPLIRAAISELLPTCNPPKRRRCGACVPSRSWWRTSTVDLRCPLIEDIHSHLFRIKFWSENPGGKESSALTGNKRSGKSLKKTLVLTLSVSFLIEFPLSFDQLNFAVGGCNVVTSGVFLCASRQEGVHGNGPGCTSGVPGVHH